MKNLNKKVTSNKTKHVDLTNNVAQISEKGYDFLLGKKNFEGNAGNQNFLDFAPIPSSINIRYVPQYHLKKLNHLILTLN